MLVKENGDKASRELKNPPGLFFPALAVGILDLGAPTLSRV